MTRSRILPTLALMLTALTVGACGGDDSSSADTAGTSAADNCEKASLPLTRSGQLTIATDKPAYPPYFEDDDPTNGRGFESAVAYAIADELGFDKSEVKWTTVPFNSSYAPGPKAFDFDVNQISITAKRKQQVDFSAPYFTAPQAVVALADSGAADAQGLSDLQDAKLGVQLGTTSLDATESQIEPSSDAQVFNDSNDTVRALKTGKVDAIVVDLPTALYITAVQVPDAKIVGQFDAPGGDEWGALLAKGSKLTPCVDRAVQKLSDTGTLNKIQEQWLGSDSAPELR